MKIYGTNVHSLKNFLKKIELTAHPKPAKAINLPPTFLTPSNQEYHIRNCLTPKDRTIY
ncbi:hypothetical protein [Leptospira weilii]|uniref:hypothetical protein n=1 Tax=Leptospira weilii TaxID=28184 RepID=UPI0003011FF1|nr:hypothetical protein [Leptospira weilii]